MATGESLNPLASTDVLSADAIRASSLYNDDLAPVTAERRSWGTYNYAALWVAMSVNIPTYLLASGMIAGGMNWKQAIFTVFLGNVLVLIPMLLNAHAGARYGIPFPVFARASFGVLGANVPALLRALVACGWFGIQTWIGGQAINAMLVALNPRWSEVRWGVPLCFAAFWLLHVIVIARGIRTIRWLQGVTAPFLLMIGMALLVWAVVKAGGFGPMLATPSKFRSFRLTLTVPPESTRRPVGSSRLPVMPRRSLMRSMAWTPVVGSLTAGDSARIATSTSCRKPNAGSCTKVRSPRMRKNLVTSWSWRSPPCASATGVP